MVISLTMVLHELASNAAKHGALKSKGGKLRVAWWQEMEGDASHLYLSWEEIGATARSGQEKGDAGYGTALIDSTVTSLGGKVERVLNKCGLSICIVIPL
jgi:two-component sensor histidine kinase